MPNVDIEYVIPRSTQHQSAKPPVRPIYSPVGPSISYVELTSGNWSLIDSEDASTVGQFNWQTKVSGSGFLRYARRYYRDQEGKLRTQGLHAFLLSVGADHINGNGLDNRRSANLRRSTQSQNNQNRRIQRNNSSGYKGVSWHQGRRRWEAIIQANGKRKDLGGFPTPELAYEAYCHAAIQLHGEFARVA